MATNPQMLIRIAANLEELKRNITEGKNQIEVTTSAMQKLATSLESSKLEQRAHNITAAIDSIGGATKLTDAEARRHLGTLDAWIAKANAMGKEVPADILKTRDALQKVGKETESWRGQLNSVAGALGVTFSVGSVIAFGQEILSMGDQIQKTADQTGLMTDEVQKLTYIGSQSGNTIEQLTGAVGQMQNRLASGDQSAVAALKQLNLTFDQLAGLDPYEQLQKISEAVGQIPNPATQAQIAMDLFGKSGIQILPTLKSNFEDLGKAAPVMSQKTVEALDKAGDALDGFKLTAKVFAAESYNYLGKVFDQGVAAVYRWIASIFDSIAGLEGWLQKIPGASKVWPTLTNDIKGATTQAQWFRDAATAVTRTVDETGKAATRTVPPIVALTKATKDAADKHKEHADAAAKTVALAPDVQHALDLMNLAHQHEAAQLALAESAWKQWEGTVAKALGNIQSNPVLLKGIDLSGIVPQIGEAAQSAGNLAGVTFASKGPSFLSSLFGSSAQLGQQLSSTILGAIQGGGNPVSAAAGLVGTQVGSNLAKSLTKEGGKLFQTALGGVLSSALPVLGSLVAPLAGALWNHLFGTAGRDSVKDFAATFGGFDQMHAKLLELGDAGEAMWVRITQKVGRNDKEGAAAAIAAATALLDAHKDKIAETAAATEAATQKQADALGKLRDIMAPDELAALTTGYQQAVAEGFTGGETDFLRQQLEFYGKLEEGDDRLKTFFYGSTLNAFKLIEGGQSEMATKIIANIKAIDDQYKTLSDSIKDEAPEEVMGVVEANTRAQMDALVKQREAAQSAINDTTTAAAQAADEAGNIIDQALAAREFRVRVKVDLDGLPNGSAIPMAEGGDFWVTRPTLFLAGEAGPERATFSGAGNAAPPRDASGSGGGDIYLTTQTILDGKVLDERTERITRKAAATGRLQTRAKPGRTY